MIFLLQEGPVSQTGEFKQSLDTFYVTDSALSVTNIAELVRLSKVLTVSVRDSTLSITNIAELVSLNKVLTDSMSQIVL